MAPAARQEGICPAPGCGVTAPLVPGVRCPHHDRPLVLPEALAENDGDPLFGRTVANDYDLIDILGRGAMGAVYRGWQRSRSRPVALKVISGKAAQALDEPGKRFVMEARALAAMPQHPSIVGIHDFGEDDGLLYMVLELVDGPSLKEFADGRRLPAGQVVDIALGILGALALAHDAGVVHRDLKPSNVVMLSHHPDETRVKVLDFGVAKVFWPDDALVQEVVTRAGMALGTPKYMSPEQARGRPVGPGSDIYALGVMMYRLLSGELPFYGENDLQLLKAHILQAPAPFSPQLGVAPALEAIVMRALAKQPVERYPDAPSMSAALLAIRDALDAPRAVRPSAAEAMRPAGRAATSIDLEPTRPDPSSQQLAAEMGDALVLPRGRGPGRALMFGLAAVGLGIVAGLIGLLVTPDPPAPERTSVVATVDPVEDNYRKAQAHARAGEGEATAEALRAAFAAASDAESLRRRTNVDPAFDAVRAHPAVEAVLAMPARKP